MVFSEKSAASPKCRALKVSSRQPGTMIANRPALRGGDQSGSRNGPAKLRLPSVITCAPPVSLAGLAFRVVDRAELRLGGRFGRVRGAGELAAARGHGIQRAR